MVKIILITFFILSTACSSVPKKTVNPLHTLIEIVSLDLHAGSLKLRITNRQKLIRTGANIACQLDADNLFAATVPIQNLPDLKAQISEIFTVNLVNLSKSHMDSIPSSFSYQMNCLFSSENYAAENLKINSILYKVPGEIEVYR